MLYEQTTINCNGTLLNISTPVVMGILNVTPDSFHVESRVKSDLTVLKTVERFITEGVSIIDIGGQSTRPNAVFIDEASELKRVLPVVEVISRAFPHIILSIDTFYSTVAKASVEAGVNMVNDISAGHLDAQMFPTIAALKVPYILMHMKGTPQTMQNNTQYANLSLDILDFLIEKIGILRGYGVRDIIVDVGFGFGKTIEQNYELLQKLPIFKILDCPILVGLSRKAMIWKSLGVTPEGALNGTTAAHMLALMGGAKILRVHDVREAVESITIFNKFSLETAKTF